MNEKEEKVIYKCSVCEKDFGVVFVVKEDGKIKNKCTRCFYKKDEPDIKN